MSRSSESESANRTMSSGMSRSSEFDKRTEVTLLIKVTRRASVELAVADSVNAMRLEHHDCFERMKYYHSIVDCWNRLDVTVNVTGQRWQKKGDYAELYRKQVGDRKVHVVVRRSVSALPQFG
jgi:hypothetical protein